MVKFAAPLFVASLFAAVAFASSAEPQEFSSRDVAEQLDARDLDVFTMVPREYLEDLFERSYDELAQMDAREIQELYERDPNKFTNFFKKIGRGIKKGFQKVASFILRREEDLGLDARDFDEIIERALDELEERDPRLGLGFVRKIIHHARPAAELASGLSQRSVFDEDLLERAAHDLAVREMQDLYERDPNKFTNFFKKIGRGIKKAVSFILRDEIEDDVVVRDFDEDLFERDLEFDGDLFERDLLDEEVYERDFDDEDLFERDFDEFEVREIDELD